MARSTYSEADISQLVSLKQSGKTWDEIASVMGRSPDALWHKYYKLSKKELGLKPTPAAVATPTVKRRGPGKKKLAQSYLPIQASPVTVSKKPMIAFVGEHSDIVAAVRELFA